MVWLAIIPLYALMAVVVGGLTYRIFDMKPRYWEYGTYKGGESGAVIAGVFWPAALLVGAVFGVGWFSTKGYLRGVRSIANIGKEKELTSA